MILVDTSVWVDVLRDKTGRKIQALRERIGADIGVLSRFTQLELLQGARDEGEWSRLDEYLATQYYLEATENTWRETAQIYYDLRRGGNYHQQPHRLLHSPNSHGSWGASAASGSGFREHCRDQAISCRAFSSRGSTSLTR